MFQHHLGKQSKKDLEKRLKSSFNSALKMSDPDQEPLHNNREGAHKAFKTLAHFAPHVAAEPSAARAFMNKMVSYDMGVDIGSIKDLTDIEKNLSQVSKDPDFLQGFRAGTEATGLKNIVSQSAGKALGPAQTALGEELMQ